MRSIAARLRHEAAAPRGRSAMATGASRTAAAFLRGHQPSRPDLDAPIEGTAPPAVGAVPPPVARQGHQLAVAARDDLHARGQTGAERGLDGGGTPLRETD